MRYMHMIDCIVIGQPILFLKQLIGLNNKGIFTAELIIQHDIHIVILQQKFTIQHLAAVNHHIIIIKAVLADGINALRQSLYLNAPIISLIKCETMLTAVAL